MKEVRSLLQNLVNNEVYKLTGAYVSKSTTSFVVIKSKKKISVNYIINNIIYSLGKYLSLVSKNLAISYS